MCRQLVLLLIVLGFCLSPAVQAATIVWVGESDDSDGDGVVDDSLWPQWLEEQGYTVDARPEHWGNLDDDDVAELNAADLVIISRNTDSDVYANNAQEIARWNSITTPMILTSPYLARASRWQWITTDSLQRNPGCPAWRAADPDHTIFLGVPLDPSNEVLALDESVGTGNTAHLDTLDLGTGAVIADVPGTTMTAIVEWSPDADFYAGGPAVAARRLLFMAGTSEDGGPQGAFNLTPAGEKLLSNAIKYMLGLDLYGATWPTPVNGAEDVRPDIVLSWMPGPGIAIHDVYLGTDFDAVNTAERTNPQDVLVRQAHDATTYDPSPGAPELVLGETYYWRVDEVEAVGGAIHRGEVWSFTVEPYAYVVPNVTASASIPSAPGSDIEDIVNGDGVLENGRHSTTETEMWRGVGSPADVNIVIDFAFERIYKLDEALVWNYNHGFEYILNYGVKDVTVAYSVDGNDWTVLADKVLPQGASNATTTAEPIDLSGVAAKYVRFIVNSNYGGAGSIGLSEVRFMYLPTFAREPQPESGAEDVAPDVVLAWRPGRGAATHEIHLGTDSNAVAAGQSLADVADVPAYDTSALGLTLGQTYYWMIREVNEAETPPSWDSDVWSFSTPDYLVVDDMESYTDAEGSRIFEAWVDGYGINSNGSLVGNDFEPFAELANVHDGDQSMPFRYGLGNATTSEATLTLEMTDWTQGGAQTLVLYFSGLPTNAVGQLYVKIDGVKVPYTGDSSAFAQPLWTQWNIDLASVGVNLTNVKTLTIGVSGAGTGKLFFDDIRLYDSAPAEPSEVVWIEAETTTTLTTPLQVLSDNAAASGGQYLTVMPGNNSMDAPPAEGIATYTFTVQGGTYKLMARVLVPTADDNSLWLRIGNATTQTENHPSGWVWWYDASVGSSWHWDNVRSNNDNGQVVQFTLPAGTHTLEIAYREDGLLIDAFVLTDGLD